MGVYYNENDPYAAQWLRNLIAANLIAPGEVDERSITEVQADDLKGFAQHHFFAGIGGWSYALRLAGWGDSEPVWTGSCPCQPVSSAGKRHGHADGRHLWPALYGLLEKCRPPVVFGEQVASGDGPEWLSGIRADLEDAGFAVGAACLPAACVGAPHQRHRLFWVGDSLRGGNEPTTSHGNCEKETAFSEHRSVSRAGATVGLNGPFVGLGFANSGGRQERKQATSRTRFWDSSLPTGCRDGKQRRTEPSILPLAHGVPRRVEHLRAFGNAIVPQVAAEFIASYMEIA